MSLRAMYRVVMAFLIVAMPLLAEVLTPAQTQASSGISQNPPITNQTQEAPQAPTVTTQATLAAPPQFCNFKKATGGPGDTVNKGIWGNVFLRNSNNQGAPALVRLYDVTDPLSVQYIGQVLTEEQFTFQSADVGVFYFGIDGAFGHNPFNNLVQGSHKYKILFIPDGYETLLDTGSGKTLNPQWFDSSNDFATAVTIGFNDNCEMLNLDTGANIAVTASLQGRFDPVGSIAGQVVFRLDNTTVLPGINVTVVDAGGVTRATATTSSNGTFATGGIPGQPSSGLAAGNYFLFFSGTGFVDSWYKDKDGSFAAPPAGRTAITVPASPTTCAGNTTNYVAYSNCGYIRDGANPIKQTLTANYTLQGTVGDQNTPTQNLENVTVRLFNSNTGAQIASTATNAAGFYQFTNVAPNVNYKLQFVPPTDPLLPGREYLSEFWSNAVDPNAADATVFGPAFPPVPPTSINDPAVSIFKIALGANPATPVVKNIKLIKGAGISGKVTGIDTGATGLSGINVELYDVNGAQPVLLATDTTDAGGFYVFDKRLLAGNYKVRFVPDQLSVYISGSWVNATTTSPTIAGGTVIPLTVGNYGTNPSVVRNIALARGAAIAGTINPPAGLAGGLGGNNVTVQINIVTADTGAIVRSFSVGPIAGNTSYNYTTPALSEGNYKVLFTPTQTGGGAAIIGGLRPVYYSSISATGAFSLADATVINIPTGSTTTQGGKNVTLTQGARLTVNVRTNQGGNPPFPGVLIQVQDSAGNILNSSQTTDAAGNVVIDYLPQSANAGDTVRVALFPPQFQGFSYGATYVLNPQAGGACQAPVTANTECKIQLQTGQNISVSQIVIPARRVFGTLTTNPPNLVGDWENTKIEVYRVDSGASVPISVTANTIINGANGLATYNIDLQSGLQYKIRFTPPTTALLPQWYNDKYQYSAADIVDVSPVATTPIDNGTTTFKAGGAFLVSANFKIGGQPVVNATVKIYAANKTTVVASGTTDALGQFTHVPLTTGATLYYIGIKPADSTFDEQFYQRTFDINQSQSLQLTSGDGKLTPVNFQLERASVLSGVIREQDNPTSDYDPTDRATPTFTVNLYDKNDTNLTTVLFFTTTIGIGPNNGKFTFPKIPEGNYIIEYVPSNLGVYPNAYYNGQVTQVTLASPPAAPGTKQNFFYGTADATTASALLIAAKPAVNSISQTYIRTNAGSACQITGVVPGAASGTSVQLSFSVTPNNACKGNAGVDFGTVSGTYPNHFTQPDDSLQHIVTINGLSPNTTYYLRPFSQPTLGGSKFPIQGNTSVQGGAEVAIRTSSDGKAWYFAAGNASITSSEIIHIMNPTGSNATVAITYYKDGATPGSASIPQPQAAVTVNAGQRLDVNVPNTLGAHSIIVQSSNQAIIVERTIYGSQQVTNGIASGGYTLLGAAGVSSKAYFPDGSNKSDIDVYYSVFNPSPDQISVNVYYLPTGNTGTIYNTSPTNATISIPAFSRFRFSVKGPYGPNPAAANGANGIPAGSNFGVYMFGIDGPFVAEQEMYYYSAVQPQRKGYTGTIGVPAEQANWNFVEATDEKVTDNTYTFINPTNKTAQAIIKYTLDNPFGVVKTETLDIPAFGRIETVLPLSAANGNTPQAGRNFGFTMSVQSVDKLTPANPRPIVLQRNVKYRWRTTPGSDGIFSQPAFGRFSTRWQFAGGDTNATNVGNVFTDMTFSIYNSSATEATVNLTYYRVGGGSIPVNGIKVAPGARLVLQSALSVPNISGIGYNQLAGVQFDSVCTGAGCQPAKIAVERTLYWSRGSIVGGNSIFGYVPPGF